MYQPPISSTLTTKLQLADFGAKVKLLALIDYFVPSFEKMIGEARTKERISGAPPGTSSLDSL